MSSELEAVVKKALEKEPDQRFQSASEFMAALDAVPEATGRASSDAEIAHAVEILSATLGKAP